jgi:hypothetical protein
MPTLLFQFAYKAFMETYFQTAENKVEQNSTTDCVEWVKLCLDTTACSGPAGDFTQIHSVGAYKRDSGNLTMQTLEGYFTQALGSMAKYDPFMELSAGFYVDNLVSGLVNFTTFKNRQLVILYVFPIQKQDYFTTAFDAAKVAYFPSTFTSASGEKHASISVQVPGSLQAGAGSLLLMELVSKASNLLDARGASVYHHPLPRFSDESLARGERKAAVARATAVPDTSPSLTFLKISFPSSDLDRDVKFFEGVLMGTKVFEQTTGNATIYAGKMLTDDVVEVHFVHSTQKTQGPM